MANAAVEKLKTFGIRHGEKVALVCVGAICLVLVFFAFSRETIDLTAEQIESATNKANQNLSKQQSEDTILEKIKSAGVEQPHFEAIVDARKPGSADPAQYQFLNMLVATEPGSGLLRSNPELIAPTELTAHSGRGRIVVLAKDENGNQVYVDPDEEAKSKKSSGGRSQNRQDQYGMMMGGNGGNSEPDAKTKRENQKKAQEREQRAQGRLAGSAGASKSEPERPKLDDAPPGTVPKKVEKGFRWVAVTGLLDHEQLRQLYARSLKLDEAGANPNYERLDVERQELGLDGTWSGWELIDRDRIDREVTYVFTMKDPETSPATGAAMAPEDTKLEPLVDDLPFLDVGYWSGVLPGALVSGDVLKVAEKKSSPGGGGGSGLIGGGMGEGPSMARGRGAGGGGVGGGLMGGSGNLGAMVGRGGGAGEGYSGMGGMFGGGGSFAGVSGDFPKSDASKIMVRAIDYTVDPDTTYRYRARVVVNNPNYREQSVEPGVNTADEFLTGPWSESTTPVDVPSDISAYVMDSADELDQTGQGLLSFAIARWDEATGLTLMKRQFFGPGDIVGKPDNVGVPDFDAGRVRSRLIDFTSDRVLVDTTGGSRDVRSLDLGIPNFQAPGTALMLRSDGTLVLRDEVTDSVDGEMQEMYDIFQKSKEDAEAKGDEASNSSMLGGGMMGGAGGSMGSLE